MVKNIVLVLAIGIAAVLGWISLRNLGGLKIDFLQGKTAILKKGNLTIPITASGSIEPKDRLTVKSEAAGTVAKIFFEEGDMVREGQLLMKLDPEDEQRMVDIAEKAHQQAVINHKRAQAMLHQRKNVDLPAAEARLRQLEEELKYSLFTYKRTKQFLEDGNADPDEMQRVGSQHYSLLARVDHAKAEVGRAQSNIELATLDVEQRELAVERAKDDLADAKERLSETQILAPSNGMLSRLLAKEGEVIASGSMSLTGGTPLASVADVSEFYVEAQVDEADIGRVREIAPSHARPGRDEDYAHAMPLEAGTPVEVTVEAFPEEVFQGVIHIIEPEPRQASVITQYVVRIRLTSASSDKLLIGMQANVEFVSESVSDVVLVPNEAIRVVDNQKGVYVPVDSQKYEGKKVPQFTPFRGGLDNGSFTQVIEGLAEGQVVYTKLPRKMRGGEITGEEDEES